MKRKRSSTTSYRRRESETLETNFVLLLAAVSRSCRPYATALLRYLLKQIRRSLISENPQTLPSYIIAVLPALMNNKSEKIASPAVEIVGLASLLSFKMNEMIAMDGEIVKGLIRAVGYKRKRVALAACNAVLDLLATEIGRRKLLEFSAVETFMFEFCQVMKTSNVVVDSCKGGNATAKRMQIILFRDELQKVLFDIVVTLVNSCSGEQLEMIQSHLSKNILVYLREIWRLMCPFNKFRDSLDLKTEKHGYLSNMKPSKLAETVFRLSMNGVECLIYPPEQVSQSFFGISDCSFQKFILNRWEESSFVLKSSEHSSSKDGIFAPFVRLLNCDEAVSSFLSDSLPKMVSCLPFPSDDLNVLDFLMEVKEKIGCPIIYQQDIRVVKTDEQVEMHYLPKVSIDLDCIDSPDVFNLNDILKCEEGYKQGYTIALRGLEFRFELIAAVADAMASMFGQPSVGVNLYLTPSNSQGLALHYDDHCVFVCQLVGEKQWWISKQPTVKLPRLYEPLKSICRSDVEIASEESNCVLREGDVLYIPRGLAHKACTMTCDGKLDAQDRFSMHLTFGIEVEPPFEWEGFAHIALHCWKNYQDISINSLSVHLLHFAIRHIGYSNPDFRKACLVGAIPTPLEESDNWLENSQRTIFNLIIDVINTKSSFSDAIREFQAALCSQKDPFRWLEHLNQDSTSRHGQSPTLIELSNLFSEYQYRQEEMEAAFIETKSDFCDKAAFAAVVGRYKMLLDKYRNARKQYTKGMLSLHCFNNEGGISSN